MLTGRQNEDRRILRGLRCRLRDLLYTPGQAELLHLRRKETVHLTARFAAFFTLFFLVAASFWDGAFAPEMLQTSATVLRCLVMLVAGIVLVNQAVSAKWRRRMPVLPMLVLVTAAIMMTGFVGMDATLGERFLTVHSILVLGLLVLVAIMPLTLLEAAVMALPFVVLLIVGRHGAISSGHVPLDMVLVALVPLAMMASVVQMYRTIVVAREIAIDPLTGVYSRAFGIEMLRLCFDTARRKGLPLSVAFVDLDDFKKLNDRFGHDYGDRVLQRVGASLAERFRRSDLVVRWGGEEFLVLLPDLTRERADEVMARVMSAGLADLEDGSVQGASYGLAERIEDAISQPSNLIDLADRRMYDAKRRRPAARIAANADAAPSRKTGIASHMPHLPQSSHNPHPSPNPAAITPAEQSGR